MDKKVIGVFDSGLGGIVILNELVKNLPNESFLYIADEANVPYGEKSTEEVKDIVSNNCEYLLKNNAKMIVIACNTATTNSNHIDLEIPVVGVVEPTARQVYSLPHKSNVLLLATSVTVKSNSYQKILKDYNVSSVACPEFVKIVEENLYHTNEAKELIKNKLDAYKNKNIKGVILGCTHFELLKNYVQDIFPDAKIFSSSTVMVEEVKAILKKENLCSSNKTREVIIQSTNETSDIPNKIPWFESSYTFKVKK